MITDKLRLNRVRAPFFRGRRSVCAVAEGSDRTAERRVLCYGLVRIVHSLFFCFSCCSARSRARGGLLSFLCWCVLTGGCRSGDVITFGDTIGTLYTWNTRTRKGRCGQLASISSYYCVTFVFSFITALILSSLFYFTTQCVHHTPRRRKAAAARAWRRPARSHSVWRQRCLLVGFCNQQRRCD